MPDLKRTIQDDKDAKRPDDEAPGHDRARTAGTNRDYDESQESKNQGHGTPREKRGGQSESGESLRTVTETDRQQRDLGGPGG